MKRWIAPLLAFALLIIAAWLHFQEEQPMFAGTIGQQMPATKLDYPLLKPNADSLRLYVFWAPWCPTCLSEIPLLNRKAEEPGTAFEIIGVAIDPKGAVALAREKLKYPVAIPKDGTLLQFFGFEAIPFHALVNSQGTVLWEGNQLDFQAIQRASLNAQK